MSYVLQIQLALGPQSSIAVGWQKKDERRSASGEVKVLSSHNLYKEKLNISRKISNIKYLHQ